MGRPEPPSVNFSLTTPNFAWGFNMQDKKWKKLAIDYVSDVDWDDKAFDNLVIDPDSKDVIQALVTNKIQNSISTDIIRGKGSGLILLLHGPPGTGKTLTAESVAEHARKPLYRVACGDIGTKPEAVEQYLKRVLSLGKSWDCVVLLDEAEVFLQERSLGDMGRNALVSVFLRNLEYYDGILILTSNRVGTFDEGFRSRIQLAIHYPKLEQASRRRVWENFVNRLNDDPIASEDIDVRNLRSNLTELSRFDLNGREIRNAINVARPLAKSEGRKVDFDSLKKVVKVQQKFYEYMKDMNEGLDDEKVAREEGKR
ncbi:P-loop containing nucleoside triphosphate hydrolase protein [Xylaria grammica]|nr:P-loop containing nucleoside triphosphate hydrolase protein [Xylaria grammica]